jgi:hypothetical protein
MVTKKHLTELTENKTLPAVICNHSLLCYKETTFRDANCNPLIYSPPKIKPPLHQADLLLLHNLRHKYISPLSGTICP